MLQGGQPGEALDGRHLVFGQHELPQ
jgi:hypothetical protein